MPQKFVNLENLTSFWGNAKEYIGNERKEIEDQLYNWQKTEKTPVVQCEPVPNSELHPVVEFKFKETLPEGEKGPDNPSTITGISSVKVGRCSKNFIGPVSSRSSQDITYTNNADGSVTFNGSLGSSYNYFAYTYNPSLNKYVFPEFLEKGQSYTLSVNLPSGTRQVYVEIFVSKNGGDWGNPIVTTINSDVIPFTIPQNSTGLCIRYTILKNTTVSNYTVKAQIEKNSSATSYEKANFNEYIINLNDTYYGGSIDLATGLMTVTWGAKTIDGTENFGKDTTYSTDTVNVFTSTLGLPQGVMVNTPSATTRFCSHFFWGSSIDANTYSTWGTATNTVFKVSASEYPDVASFKSWLASEYSAGHPVVLGFLLNNPYTVQLTPTQIKSLVSLEGTSKRINTLYTDADSIQVEYQKYVGIDSTLNSDSVNAIQNKVVNSALNTKVSLTGDETIAGSKTFSSPINGSVTGDAGTVAGHIVSKDVPINAVFTDTTYDPATQSTAGLMSASDKVKLDAVGSVFSFKGSVVNSSSLPASDNVNGDAYLAEDTGHVHVYDGSSFVDIGVWAGIPSATDAQIDALFED